jgi:hypothetical protein
MAGEIGEMNIRLVYEAQPIRQRPYRLNPIYKKKVKEEIDRMLEPRIIELVEEFEWVSLMVVQEINQGGIRICVDLRKINDACLHDPFPTPFDRQGIGECRRPGSLLIHRWILMLPSDQDSPRRQVQDQFFHRMGVLPVHSHSFWTEEHTNNIF